MRRIALLLSLALLAGCIDDVGAQGRQMGRDWPVSSGGGTLAQTMALGNSTPGDGTNLVVSDQDKVVQTSTATSGSEVSVTVTPGGARSSDCVHLEGVGGNFSDGAVLNLESNDADQYLLTGNDGSSDVISFQQSGQMVGVATVAASSGSVYGFSLTTDISGVTGSASVKAYAFEATGATEASSGLAYWIYGNAPTSFSGRLMQLAVGGSTKFLLESDGSVTLYNNTQINGGLIANYYAFGAVSGNYSWLLGTTAFDQIHLRLGSEHGRVLCLTPQAQNCDHGVEATPTLAIHGTAPDTDNTDYIKITHDTTDAVVDVGSGALNFDVAGTTEVQITSAGGMAYTPTGDQVIVAGTGITVAMLKRVCRVAGNSGNIDITANPQIADGVDGQIVTFQGTHDTDTVQFDDGNGIATAGAASRTLGQGDMFTVLFDAGDDLWYEVSFSNN